MKKVMLVFGTRPEAIKMCPLVKEFQKYPKEFETIVCVTGQHREMLDQVLRIFEVKPDFIEGDIKRVHIDEFNSNNTRRLSLEETIAKVVSLDYIQNELNGISNTGK